MLAAARQTAVATTFAVLLAASGTTRGDAPAPLPARHLLEKLSFKLRGVSPTADEVREFEARVRANPGDFTRIYADQVQAYMEGPAFDATVERFHSVWWRLQTRESTRLAADIVASDRPYFEILARDYVYADGVTAPTYRRTGIKTLGPLPNEAGDWRAVRLAEDEPRFRSVLGNLDFLDAFPDTATNRNRKRANYVLSTFLCESLAPTMPEPRPVPTPGADPHGTDPDCAGCHYRLDPLARFFDRWRPPYPNATSTWFDAAKPAVGKLIVRTADGAHFDYDGQADAELGRILAGEPRVHECVVQKVWEHLLGPAVKLDPDSEAALVHALDARQSFKDLVRAVLDHPYFRSTRTAPPLQFADVRTALGVCAACHWTSDVALPRFDPSAYPFAPNDDANVHMLTKIFAAVNHEPGYKAMPASPSPGVPAQPLSTAQLARLREWIAEGAYDAQGQRTLSDAAINEVLRDQ